jgi:hypothetical protein
MCFVTARNTQGRVQKECPWCLGHYAWTIFETTKHSNFRLSLLDDHRKNHKEQIFWLTACVNDQPIVKFITHNNKKQKTKQKKQKKKTDTRSTVYYLL